MIIVSVFSVLVVVVFEIVDFVICGFDDFPCNLSFAECSM